MATRVADQYKSDPVTLHRVMRSMIGDGLRARYEPPQKVSHELFVLLMQLKENERSGKARARRAQAKPRAILETAPAAP
jgi:hypothetical protein